MLYFIVTTSVFNDCENRKSQYIDGISKLKEVIQQLDIQNYKIIIVENNGKRETFLNSLHSEVFYTNNNFIDTKNKGYKELEDIFEVIHFYNIHDNDFIVKMTGRYIVKNDSEFMNIIKNIENTNYQCVIKYGSYEYPVNHKVNDCITGLIGMSCFYVKKIEKPKEHECVEWKWAEVTHQIENRNIYIVNNLGLYICPGSNKYFLIDKPITEDNPVTIVKRRKRAKYI